MAPRLAVFDLNGTLMDTSVLAEPLGTDAAFVRAALDDAVAQAMATTLTGEHAAFRDLLGAALRRRLERADRDTGVVGAALERLATMPPFPEAEEALDRLAGAGVALAVLTQSATQAADAVLESAGLRDRFAFVLGADALRAFKPDPRTYRAALGRGGVAARDAVLVAAHWWDVMGAKRAGLRTAWISRAEDVLLRSVPEPDVRAGDLREAAGAILALP